MTTPEERIGVLEAKFETVHEDLAELRTDVRAIRTTLAEAKGGWKTLLLVAGMAGLIATVGWKLLGLVGLAKP